VRLWGWKENAIEVARDEEELGALAKAGKPLYGQSDLPEYVQGVAHRNSLWSKSPASFAGCRQFMLTSIGSLCRSTQVWCPALVSSFQRCSLRVASWDADPTSLARRFNLVNHNHHGVDTAKYGSKDE